MNDSFIYSKSDPDINFYDDISRLDTKYVNLNETFERFECFCKYSFSVLHENIWSIIKNFEAFKHFYSTLNCMFSEICFSETWVNDNSICKNLNFQIENYIVVHQIRESGRKKRLSIFVPNKFTLSYVQTYPSIQIM